MNKVVGVTGANGRLGKVLVDRFRCVGIKSDITRFSGFVYELDNIQPDIIINCAAYTNVDEAETSGHGKSIAVNAGGVYNIKKISGVPIIHVSTDFVFDGKDGPYDEKAKLGPINWYGKSKLLGEEMLLEFEDDRDVIVRTTVLFGGHKPDFATTVLGKLKNGQTFTLPRKLFGNPTHVLHLAEALMYIVNMENTPQIVNVAGANWMSRYDFGVMLANKFGYDPKQIQHTLEIPGAAKRPKWAGLDVRLAKSLNIPIYSVQDAINQLFIEKANVYGQYPTK